MERDANKQINVFRLKIHTYSMAETLNKIELNVINKVISMQHIVVNAAKIVNSQSNEKLRSAINNSDLINVDGKPVVWVLKILGYKNIEKVSGIDLFFELLKLCEQKGYKPYFLGAKQEVLDKMLDVIKVKHPELNVAGATNGYFTTDEEEQISENIKNSNADMLFLGITSPKKELFLDKYTKAMNIPFSMGVGGSFDIMSGKVKRAPKWMQNYGLEWFFRLIQEPRRMWKRYLVTNTLFIYYSFKEFFRK